MRFRPVFLILLTCGLAGFATPVLSQGLPVNPKVHFIWMGGNDCPPCKVWRGIELPLLEQSPEFKKIKYTYVTKSITAAVPPRFFLPDDIKPYKDILDAASSGGAGSPQAALIVDAEVFDYFHGTRSASEIESMLFAVRTGAPYPFRRCIKMSQQGRGCEVYKP